MELPQKVYYINLENKQENNKLFLQRIIGKYHQACLTQIVE